MEWYIKGEILIVRTDIFCPGCNQKIRLRISIGLDKSQPFYLICKNCKAVIHGRLLLGEPPSYWLEFEEKNIKVGHHEQPDQVINLHPDLPSIIDAADMTDSGGSPFLSQIELMESQYMLSLFMERLGFFRGIIASDWNSLYRLSEYYLNREWKYFDKEAKHLLGDEYPNNISTLGRHDIYHRLLEILFMNITPKGIYSDLKAEYSGVLTKIAKDSEEVLKEYNDFLLQNFDIQDLQRKTIERLYFIVNNFSALAPAFPVFFYKDYSIIETNKLRILRDDFNILKSHFLDAFEICHKILTIVVGMQNILERKHWDAFPNNKPQSLKKYHILTNFQKAKYITLPRLKEAWYKLLDRKLRNMIGHASARHNLQNGLIELEDGRKIPYVEFVYKTLALTEMILFSMHILKMIYIIDNMYK